MALKNCTHIFHLIKHYFGRKGKEDMGIPKLFDCF